MTDKEKYEALVSEIKRLKDETAIGLNEWENGVENGRMEVINALEAKVNSMNEEPIYTDFTKALAECISQAQGSVVDPMVHAETWRDELIKLAKSEEPVSEDLEEAAIQFATDTETGKVDVVKQGSFFWGAKWKEQQFEKNRLKHCDSITNEQAELEQKFLDQHLDKHQRMPTFLDAIEYGMRLKEEQINTKED